MKPKRAVDKKREMRKWTKAIKLLVSTLRAGYLEIVKIKHRLYGLGNRYEKVPVMVYDAESQLETREGTYQNILPRY